MYDNSSTNRRPRPPPAQQLSSSSSSFLPPHRRTRARYRSASPSALRAAFDMGPRSATTTRPAHAHTNAPRLLNKFSGGGAGDDSGRGRPILGKGTKRPLWDVTADVPKWAPPPVMITAAGKKAVARRAADALALECARATALDKLRKRLNAAGGAAGAGAPPPQAFERWRFAAKHAEETDPGVTVPADARDPSVPSVVDADDGAPVAQLESDLARAGVPAGDAARVAREIATSAAAEALALRKLRDRLRGAPAADAAPVTVAVTFRKHSVELVSSKGGHFVVLSRVAYGKLAAMYRRNAPPGDPELPPLANDPANGNGSDGSDADGSDGDDSDGDGDGDGERAARGSVEEAESRAAAASPESASRTAFHARLFALLLRYKSIQGYGFQASVGPGAFETLRDAIGAGTECFASPLNAFFPRFFSAFPDVDAPFGSCGDFFAGAARLKRGCYQANPPFVGHVMSAMARAMHAALDVAERDDQPLTFVVFVPGWTDEPSWVSLSESPRVRSKFVVAAADHGYCDGAAHQRKASFRGSSYDTGVFVLQSSRAAASAAGRRVVAGPTEPGGLPRFEAEVRAALAGARLAASVVAAVVGDAAAGGRKKRKKKESREGGDEEGDEGRKKKKEKKKESKAAKKRRKRREGKTDAAKVADGGEANE